MRMKVPITGTVTEIVPFIAGDPDDPISPVRNYLGEIDWRCVDIDLVEETMEIELLPKLDIDYESEELDENEERIWKNRPTTPQERAQAIDRAKDVSLERMSKQALYALSGSPRLKNPFKKVT